ncbi:MAG TPA: PstA family ABC transporter permease [Thermoanaerobaculia bacterium]|jgi:phosphate transport system permease protein|nr:PstA family ABC transporter permease [Thermoanaerobaculia bacterium]
MRFRDRLLVGLFTFSILLTIAILVVILGIIAARGAGQVDWGFLTQPPRDGLTGGGIWPAIVGTAALVLLMTVVAVPLGVATAVYLHEYTPREGPQVAWKRFKASNGEKGRASLLRRVLAAWLAVVVRSAVANLAGVPSIVFGLFGLGFFIQFVGGAMDRATQPSGEIVWGQGSLIWAALTLALLTLPTVIVATEEALRTVPPEQREASLALGATRWETVRRVVLPASLPGILTGAILGISRGAGEVAPILFTGAAYFLPFLPQRVTDQFMHLGYHVLILSTQSPDVNATEPLLYGTVFVLLALTFLLNLTGVLIRTRTRARLAGR